MSEEISSLTGPWAELRFAVVGPLLASPPKEGRLQAALQELAAKEWRNPITGASTRFSFRTIERWYYQARGVPERESPVSALRKKLRKDRGWQRSLSERMERVLRAQYAEHPSWTARLHHDNLVARAKNDGTLGEVPSYATVRRFLRSKGLRKLPRRPKRNPTAGQLQATQRLEQREVRTYEVEHVGALWHLDFHEGSLPVLLANGVWEKPMLLGILDDHSRLACHLQWYLGETAEYLVHGLSQAVLKRGLPRALMSDNGSAMIDAETREGLLRIGVHHERTLPYSPYQNGKQEAFWRVVEGRLLAMLEGVPDLSLELLNRATQALGGAGVQPRNPLRDRADPAPPFPGEPESAPRLARARRPATRLHAHGASHPAQGRRHGQDPRRPLRGAFPLPVTHQDSRPLRGVGPLPGLPRRRGIGSRPHRHPPHRRCAQREWRAPPHGGGFRGTERRRPGRDGAPPQPAHGRVRPLRTATGLRALLRE